MNPTPRIDSAKHLDQLFKDRFPIRGWSFDIAITPVMHEHRFKFYAGAPALDDEGLLLPGVSQPRSDEVLTAHLKLRARFKIPPQIQLLGRIVEMTPDGIEKGVVQINVAQRSRTISVYAGECGHYEGECFYPEHNSYLDKVKEYSEKRRRAYLEGADIAPLNAALAQLQGIRENAHSILTQCLGEIGNRILTEQPDYWMLVEMFLRNLIHEDKVNALGRGVVVVTPYRPGEVNPTKVTIQ